jgi:UDP-glucose 4-epimerase
MSQMRAGKPLTITEGAMTRFLLPLSGAIDLILFAFGNARPGDIFIKKSPACTVDVLAAALGEMFGIEPAIRRIGMRHGEKLYETLASREELRRAQDMGDYWRVTMDGRGLDYAKYFTEGDTKEAGIDDYTSHNTERLDVAQVKALLLTLPEVQAELAAGPVQAPAGATARAKAGTATRAKPAAKTAPRPGGGKPRGRPRKTPA